MDSQRAREILLLYRSDSSDANDPEFKEALEQVSRDPDLRGWFEGHCARQALIRDQFRRISIPGDLRQRILEEVGRRKKIVGWRRPALHALSAAAAAIVLLVGLIYFSSRPEEENSFAAYRNRMVRQAQRLYQMDMVANDLIQIRQYLASREWPADYVLTKAMEEMGGVGCKAMQWRSNRVSLVCLNSGKPNDLLYLFVIDRSFLADAPRGAADRPQMAKIGKLTSASWSQEGKTYILASSGDEQFIRKFF